MWSGGWRRAVLVVLLAALVTPAVLLPVLTTGRPAEAAVRYTTTDEAYGPNRQQVATVHRPVGLRGRAPVVYFVHGGSWRGMGRYVFTAEAARWAEQGWITVNLDWRTDVNGFLMVQDIEQAVAKYARAKDVDPHRQIVYGASSGGHLATLVAARNPGRFAGVVAWSPVISPHVAYRTSRQHDMHGYAKAIGPVARDVWGRDWTAADPLSRPATTPLWIAASTSEWVPWQQHGSLLCAELRRACSKHVFAGTQHAMKLTGPHPELLRSAFRWASAQSTA